MQNFLSVKILALKLTIKIRGFLKDKINNSFLKKNFINVDSA